MKVTLNIQDDAELRSHIKDAIKGQVLSILREEIIEIVKEEMTRKVRGLNSTNMERMIASAVHSIVKQILRDNCKVSEWNDAFVMPVIEAKVSEAIKNKDWAKMIDTLAKEKVRSLIN